LTELPDYLDDFWTVFIDPRSSLEDVRGSWYVGDGVYVFVVDVSFSERKFDGVCDSDGVGSVYCPEEDGGFEFKAMGEVTGFNLFYES
jgi:hypothetical protein